MPNAAAIYARISNDPHELALGVKRQADDCQALAARRGWPVAEVYVDNDVSAYRSKVRPAYRRMCEDIKAGTRDAVIVYHLDRLHRQPRELEEFLDLCDAAGLRAMASVSGDVDLATDDGRLMARIMGAVARKESDDKSRRVRRKHAEIAEAGRLHGGGTRPYGYERDRLTVRPDEAQTIRALARRLLAGESLSSLCGWLNEEQVPTVTGSAWTTATLRTVLRSGRISGQRDHHREIVGPAVWPAIITPAETTRIRALLDDPSRRTNRTARRYLLAGLLRCQQCGATLYGRPRDRTAARYICKRQGGAGGCGRVSIAAQRVDELLSEAVLFRLDSPALGAALAGDPGGEEAAQLHEQLDTDQAQLDELAGLYGQRAITAREWTTARAPIEARMTDARRRLSRLNQTTAVDGYLGQPSRLRQEWPDLPLSRQTAIIKAVLDHAVVGPGRPGRNGFDPERVHPVWRL